MVHPALAAVSLGLGIGAAVFLLVMTMANSNRNNSNHRRQNAHYREDPPYSWRDPMNGCRDFEDTCAICLDSLEDHKSTLRCGHQFHSKCISENMKFNHLCPLCREQAAFL